MANNNIPSSDPFLLEHLIEDSTREVTNRRRQEEPQHALAGQRRPRHETSQPRRQRVQNIQQLQGLQQNENETDARDGHAASSFTHTSDRQRARHVEEEEPLNIPEDTDPITVRLLKELQKTNSLIRLQDDRIHELERKRRYRSPPRRHYRSRSYSSSRSPPRRHRRRSPSSSRSPPRRHRRRRSYSRSPPRKSRKNQRPEVTEARSLSPEQGHRGPSKAVLKPRECPSPRDNRVSPNND
ncbi:uncharacterized protein LOC131657897 [Vicia villosa]|uniref:uncharacterized protein LOC131657897 n=1 Tax=Vicia villosa TaxID=3911 RepID=UPI00273B263F|nr:uncharacterized protein LOC131657897 [Vicia villosa]